MRTRIAGAISSLVGAGIAFLLFPHMIWSSFLIVVCVFFLVIPPRVTIEKYAYRHLSFSRLQEAVQRGSLSMRNACALIARVWLFPFFMFAYLTYLFVKETHLRDIHYTRFFLSVDEYLLIGLLLVSGMIWGARDEGREKEYVFTVHSALWGRIVLVGVCLLAGIGTWVVAEKTLTLGLIGYTISASVGMLIILLGVMMFDEGE